MIPLKVSLFQSDKEVYIYFYVGVDSKYVICIYPTGRRLYVKY